MKIIPKSFDILEQCILTVKEIEEDGNPPSINQKLLFSIDIDDYDDDHIEEIKDTLDDIQYFSSKSKCFLPIIKYKESEENFLRVVCKMPYTQLISTYYQENEISETEMKIHCVDLVEIYNMLKEEFLELNLSVDDMSLALYRNKQSPVSRICITPYAFLKSLLNSFEGKETKIYQPFENIFRFFDKQVAMHNCGKKQFTTIVNTLASDEDVSHLFENHQFLKSCKQERNIPKLDLDELEVEHLLGTGSYGPVMKVKSKINNSSFALKVSNCYSSDS